MEWIHEINMKATVYRLSSINTYDRDEPGERESLFLILI